MSTALLTQEALNAADPMQQELLDCLTMVGDSAWDAKEWTAAHKAYRLVLRLDGRNTHALNRVGRVQLIERQPRAALEYFERAYRAGAKDAATCVNAALAHTRLGEYEQGLAYCAEALSIDPGFLPAFVQKAAIYHEVGAIDQAAAVYEQARVIDPDDANLKFGQSVLDLVRGNFAEGWANYEYRPDRVRLVERLDEYAEWRGEDLDGKTILVCHEQGLGDQIMWARYLPLLTALGAERVVCHTMPELARLFAVAFPEIECTTSDREIGTLDPDYWVAMGSLPLRWMQFESIDRVGMPQIGELSLPYLWADAPVPIKAAGLKVGICWRGGTKHPRDAKRSLAFEQIAALREIPGITLFSLQYGAAPTDLPCLTETCHDLLDTARQIAGLDLIVTVDTAILHLAGAMGIPAIALLANPPDWRWGLAGAETPWYASVTLVRQEIPGAWEPVLDRVGAELRERAASVQASGMPGVIPARTPVRTADCRYGRMSWLANDHYIGRALELYGEYSEAEMELLRQVLQPGDVAVDAGANVGGLAYGIAAAVGLEGCVFAIEPQPSYFACLVKHAPRPVSCHHAAAGRETGVITMRQVEERRVHAPGWESTGEPFEVPQLRIDDLGLRQCALIKVDVDGPEHDILLGAEQTIDRCRPVLYVEHDKPEKYPDLLRWLLGKRYRLYQHMAPLYNPNNFRGNRVNVFQNIVSAMVLCVPNERKDLRFGLPRIRAEKIQ